MGDAAGYFRHPTIHGERIVFVGEDDLWSVPAAGGVPRRLTASPAACSFPVLSPDGTRVAFTARDEGPAEAYVIDAAGGDPQRLTWLGAMTTTVGWSRDGSEVLVASDAGQPFRGYAHLHAVPAAGGPARRLPLGPARALAFEPKGKGVALARNSGDPARWKRYRGGTAGTLWIDRAGAGEFAPFAPLDGNLAAPMWIGDRVFFLSDHEGHGNLYSARPDGTDLRRHTDHEDFYVRFPGTDGGRIVYHAGADLFVFDPATGRTRTVAVEHRSPRSQRTRRFVPARRHLESFDLHPEGHSVALTVRGQVHAMGLFDGPATRIARPAARLRLAAWLPDGKRLVAVSDEGGEERVVVLAADGSAPPRAVGGDVGRPLELAVATKGADRVALANQRNEVIVVDLSSGETKVVERSAFDRVDGLAWSPDGRRLAYGFPASRRTSCIRLHDLATGTTVDATRPEFRDGRPSFDPDGRYLYFVSYRVFDPVYDAHYFDLGFPKGARPCLVTLRKDVPSPFSSTHRPPRGVAAPAATPPPAAPPGTAPAGPPPVASPAPPAAPAAPESGIDLDGLADRVVAFPVPESRLLAVLGAPGRAFFLTWPVEGSLDSDWRAGGEPEAKGTLEAWDFDADKAVTTATGVTSAAVSLDGKTLAIRAGNRVRAVAPSVLARDLPAKEEPGRESGWIDMDRPRVEVVPADEWRQMFLEAWRLQRDQFWTADMSGVDWKAVRDRYLPLVPRCATRAEFSDLLWELQGELGTSHAYEIGGDYRPEPTWHPGFLGADLAWDAAARGWRVERVPHGDSWEPAKSSPLSAPGVLVRAGDVVVAVDGEPVTADAPPAARLVHRAGRDVRLTLAGKDGAARTVAVRTLKEEHSLRYRDWVETNRAKVHAASGGRLGYVHVINMGPVGYAEFHRAFAAEVERDGLIVDVRWNGGGHVSQLLLEKLMRPAGGWNASRWAAPQPYPEDAPRGPMVALTNEYAGSDGDIFSHSFKRYRLGPLIGKRTWGGVVGIWPRHALVDGTITTQPEFAFWFEDVGYGVEGRGVVPDVEVEIRPQDHAKGLDPQLARGIEEGLALVKTRGGRAPDLAAARPPRAPKPLPKRAP